GSPHIIQLLQQLLLSPQRCGAHLTENFGLGPHSMFPSSTNCSRENKLMPHPLGSGQGELDSAPYEKSSGCHSWGGSCNKRYCQAVADVGWGLRSMGHPSS